MCQERYLNFYILSFFIYILWMTNKIRKRIKNFLVFISISFEKYTIPNQTSIIIMMRMLIVHITILNECLNNKVILWSQTDINSTHTQTHVNINFIKVLSIYLMEFPQIIVQVLILCVWIHMNICICVCNYNIVYWVWVFP